MRQLSPGERLPLTSTVVSVELDLPGTDACAFLVDEHGKLLGDSWLVFYNNPTSPDGAVRRTAEGRFELDLARLDPRVARVALTATAERGDLTNVTGALVVRAGEAFRLDLRAGHLAGLRGVILAEVYKKGAWRLAALAQGYPQGLDALVRHYGGDVEGTPSRPAPTPPPAPAAPPPPPPAAPAAPKVSLGKVTLEKRGQSVGISLQKDRPAPKLHVNLNWNQQPAKRGFLGMAGLGGGGGADLDLGCMYELQDGSKGVLQALGGNFGSGDAPPWILIDKDDRSGAATDGENLWITRPDLIRRVLVFAFIYSGTPNFTNVGGRLTLTDPRGSEILIHLDAPEAGLGFCGVALFENRGGEIRVTKEERYFRSHPECDDHYGFGFSWRAARKS